MIRLDLLRQCREFGALDPHRVASAIDKAAHANGGDATPFLLSLYKHQPHLFREVRPKYEFKTEPRKR